MADIDLLLSQLNTPQREAVLHESGPVLILAGAGSGKTRTLTYKIAYLIAKRIATPDRLLAVTFTNKAADEMRNRVETLIGSLPSPPLISTFHSLGVRLLRRHASAVGYRPSFVICDTDDQKRLLRQIIRDLGIEEDKTFPDRVRSVISHAKNRGLDPDSYLTQSRNFDAELIHNVYRTYQDQMERLNAVDFDDLILLTVRLLRENPSIRDYYSNRFAQMMVDEYQDTNAPQYDLIRLLCSGHQNICAVGDEDQSIYGFRGADISNILRFETDFAGARVIKLEQNYRSTQNILDVATAVVSNNLERKNKVLWTDSDQGDPVSLYVADDAWKEAAFVASTARDLLLAGQGPIAVLYRTNFQSRQFEEAFRNQGIHYKLIGSLSFYSRKEVKDALAYLRLLHNPLDDVALARVLNEPPRGIGNKTQEWLRQIAREQTCSLWEAIQKALEDQVFPGKTHLSVERFRDVIEKCRKLIRDPLYLTLEQVLDRSGYMAAVREESDENNTRLLNLQELINTAREFGESSGEETIQDFLDRAALYSETDEIDVFADVSLMTLHNAKGLEFPIVFLVGCEEGIFPHSRAIAENDLEEERRLCYVGLTRARRKLYLTYSRRRRFFGRESEEINRPSRFLHEIPSHLIENISTGSNWNHRKFATGPVVLRAGSLLNAPEGRRPFAGKTYDSVASVQQALKEKSSGRKGMLRSGAAVIHPKFGRGRVLAVEETGDDLKVTVQFPGKGIKKLLQSYANLRLA